MNPQLTIPRYGFALGLILVCLIGYLLIAGRSLLMPIVVAILIWHLLNSVYSSIKNLVVFGQYLPAWLCMLLSFLLVSLSLEILINIIGSNVSDVIAASSRYQEKLLVILNRIDAYFHIQIMTNLDSFMKGLSVQGVIVGIYGVFSSITSSAVLILLYVAFLFVEQHYFQQKMEALIPKVKDRELFNNIINHIVHDTQTYLGIKTLMSILTALFSWIIMKLVGLDFADFWALLIFFLNFIPNIGAIIATAFPALLALIQFDSLWPFILLTSGLVIIQFIIGNIIEPRYLSKSLNLSPLVILIALALWGEIWGVLGMFLAIPISVMLMIVFAHFDKTRSIAVLLSQDGDIQKLYEKLPTD